MRATGLLLAFTVALASLFMPETYVGLNVWLRLGTGALLAIATNLLL